VETTANGNGQAASTAGRPNLKRSLGLWMATALVIGTMVGSGVLLLLLAGIPVYVSLEWRKSREIPVLSE
jgi:hypothetical protein